MLGSSRYGMEEMKWEGGRKQQLKQLCVYTHTQTLIYASHHFLSH